MHISSLKPKINTNIRGQIQKFATASLTGLVLIAGSGSAFATGNNIVYNAIPDTLPPNVVSLGYEAESTSEFGDFVHLGGTSRKLNDVTVTMSNWALASEYSNNPLFNSNSVSWTHPITINVYGKELNANGTPKKLLATKEQTITIPWRPFADSSCDIVTKYRAADGRCYNGLAFNAKFNLSSLRVTLPDDIIIGVAYNTADYGKNPLHVAGPYNSLNVGVPDNQVVSVGRDDNTDNAFVNSSNAGFYTDGGSKGFGIFREDTNYTPNGSVAFKITATDKFMGTSKDDCKNNGWKTLAGNYKNQGDCVSSVVKQS